MKKLQEKGVKKLYKKQVRRVIKNMDVYIV